MLEGKGFFTTDEAFKRDWQPSLPTTEDAYEITVDSGTLKMKKKSEEEGGKVNFDDGVYITVPGDQPKPRHIQFYCKTSMSGSAEACDFRIAKVKPPSASSAELITTWKGSQVVPIADGTTPADRRNLSGQEMIRFPYRTLLEEEPAEEEEKP